MKFNLSEWALAHRSFVWFLIAIAIVAGGLAYEQLGREEDPAFAIKTMVVQAYWPGATVEDTRQQITQRIERAVDTLDTLDFTRSYTTAGRTTIFVNLVGSATAREVPDIWYHVRKSIGDIQHTLPAGIVGPGFNDDFGDTFGIIYGFTADGFTHRELRDYVEDIRSKLLSVPDVSKIEVLGAQDERIFVEFSMPELASLGIDRSALIAALRSDCFYIGALGSRKTHGKRLERLAAAGFDEAATGRIHAPIGLDIGAVSPAEIALAILAEIVSSLRGPRRKPA